MKNINKIYLAMEAANMLNDGISLPNVVQHISERCNSNDCELFKYEILNMMYDHLKREVNEQIEDHTHLITN